MSETSCIFCRIANGEIPSTTLFENESFRVIYDIAPASFGHAIILPKKHARDIYELPDREAGEIFLLAKRVAGALQEATGCDGINILQNNGEAAGQSVFHLHVHVIPRYRDDTVTIGWRPGEADLEKLKGLTLKLSHNS